jgi:hypothetical protein
MGTGWVGEGRWCRGKISLTAGRFDGKITLRQKRVKTPEDIEAELSLIVGIKAALNRVPFYKRIFSPGRQK